jgi:XapX domain-containing protein
MLKLLIGLVIAVIVGIGCRWFGLPLPGPPAIMGAAMAVAMATGYTATDYLLTHNRSVTTSPAPESSMKTASVAEDPVR